MSEAALLSAPGEVARKTLRVAHLQRRPFPGYFSIEGQFEELRAHMPEGIACRPWICPHLSRGALPRIANTLAARRVRADVYHVTGDVHYLSLGLPRERTLLTIHDCVFATQTRGLRRWALRKTFYEWAVAHAARVTVISETVRRELLQLVPAAVEKVSVVPCCLPQRFTYSPKEFASVPEVLLVGTTPNKNLPRALEALKGLTCRIHVVGRLDAAQQAALAATGAKWRNSIDLKGEAMVSAYREADVVALLSTYEGFGLPIIEAQAVGRVVVASNTSSLPEASGGAAILVDPLDVASISAGFARAMGDSALRSELLERGRLNAARFAPALVAQSYAALYEVLNQAP